MTMLESVGDNVFESLSVSWTGEGGSFGESGASQAPGSGAAC